MFAGPLQIAVVFVIVLGVPLIAALFLARAGHWFAVFCELCIVAGLGIWLYLQTNGVLNPILDQTSAGYLLIFVALPACVAAVLGALIGWIIHSRRAQK